MEKHENPDFLKDKTVLITGGAGSIGSELVRQLLAYPLHSIRIYDNNEYAVDKLVREIGYMSDKSDKLRAILGDIRDRDKVRRAVRECDIVIHTAAIKNINISEQNPDECVDTNINGTLNLLRACIYEEPELLCNISTDKAVNPTTLYGCSKYIAEYLITWIDKVVKPMKAFNVRFGNIIETRGNVFEVWREQEAKGEPITVTDLRMKRYFMHVDQCASMIIKCLELAKGGETFVPKMQLYEMQSFIKTCNYKIIGLRESEKMSEELLSQEELKRAKDIGDIYVV